MRKKTSLSFQKKFGRWVVYKRNGGFDLWSRVVYQNFVLGGAEIPKGIIVHHLDGDCINDVPSNLEGTTRNEHAPLHHNGTNHSEETKQKIGEGNKGKERSQETLQKLSESHMGKVRSQESIEKQRASMLGRKQTEEHTEKVRQKLIGRPVSQETREKISKSKTSKKYLRKEEVSQ